MSSIAVDLSLRQFSRRFQLAFIELDVGFCLQPVGIGACRIRAGELPAFFQWLIAGSNSSHDRAGDRQERISDGFLGHCDDAQTLCQRSARLDQDLSGASDLNKVPSRDVCWG